MVNKKYPVSVSWVHINREGFDIPIFYDDKADLVDEFNEYIDQIARSKWSTCTQLTAYRSQIELVTNALKTFLRFLCENMIDWRTIDDRQLTEFREWAYAGTLADARSRTDKSARRTTNRKMREIYEYLSWAQETMGYVTGLIGLGPMFSVNSILPRSKVNEKVARTDPRKFPLLYQRVGEGSRTRKQYSASTEDKTSLINFFIEGGSDPYIVERNILIMELADQSGWRCGSLQSLTVEQFSNEVLQNADGDKIRVSPKKQKLGYENSFDVPLSLATRINRHIQERRRDFVLRKGIKLTHISSNLWLSAKSNNRHELTREAIVEIFSDGFRKIGCPRGSGIHSFRRKFAQDATDREVAYRKRHKLSLAPEDATLIIGQMLGQSSRGSQETYLKSRINESNQSLEARQAEEINLLMQQLADSQLDVSRLLRMVELNDKARLKK